MPRFTRSLHCQCLFRSPLFDAGVLPWQDSDLDCFPSCMQGHFPPLKSVLSRNPPGLCRFVLSFRWFSQGRVPGGESREGGHPSPDLPPSSLPRGGAGESECVHVCERDFWNLSELTLPYPECLGQEYYKWHSDSVALNFEVNGSCTIYRIILTF